MGNIVPVLRILVGPLYYISITFTNIHGRDRDSNPSHEVGVVKLVP